MIAFRVRGTDGGREGPTGRRSRAAGCLDKEAIYENQFPPPTGVTITDPSPLGIVTDPNAPVINPTKVKVGELNECDFEELGVHHRLAVGREHEDPFVVLALTGHG